MQPNDQPQNAPVASGTDPNAGATHVPTAPEMDPALAGRVDAFKKNLAYLWAESLDLTGLPADALLGQIFANASSMGLHADGAMLNFGAGARFVPTKECIGVWTNAFFANAGPPANQMAEA